MFSYIFKILFYFASILLAKQKKLLGIHIKQNSRAMNESFNIFSAWVLFHILCDMSYDSSKVFSFLTSYMICLEN